VGTTDSLGVRPRLYFFSEIADLAGGCADLRRPTDKTKNNPYGPDAERAARIAETKLREAAARRAELDALEVAARAAEIDERERALAAREQLIRALESRLEESRRRLEDRLEQVRSRPVVPGVYVPMSFHVPSIDEGYFEAGSNVDEDAWWSRQLGKPPQLAA
jgi:multidrug efflux pump subunit AcrA (membrane-fusion protein)